MQAQQNGMPMIASLGYVALVDDELAQINAAACMGCGVCVAHCPQEAISLVCDLVKGEPLEIKKLIAQAIESRDDKRYARRSSLTDGAFHSKI